MRLGLWMTALAMTCSVASAANEALSEAQIWKKTKLSHELTARFINNNDCNSSVQYLKSCRAAIAAAHDLLGNPKFAFDHDDFEASLKQLEKLAPANVPLEQLRARAINAHLEVFDPYAAIKASEEFRNTQTQKSKNYVGIGMAIEQTPEGIKVRETYSTSPAGLAGLREGDLIVAIASDGRNFEDARKFTPDMLGDKVAGENGEPMAIRIERQGRQIEYQNIKRSAVKVKYLNGEMLDTKEGVGYIRIRSFESLSIAEQFKAKVRELQRMKMKKLIIDLRGNRGGDKFMGVTIAELFLGAKKVTGTQLLDDRVPSIIKVMNIENTVHEKTIEWEGGFASKPTFNFPVVVLVDAQTASASEILAGALQDHEAAWLVGERTYGKGSAQTIESIPGIPSLNLKWTSEKFYLPSGRSNQGLGIMPSFEVPRSRGENLTTAMRLRELDVKPNSLAVESQPWIETRPQEQSRIQNCVNQHPPEDIEDYQKAYAMAVLGCQGT